MSNVAQPETKELTLAQKQELALKEMQESNLWAPPELTKKDIVIPRLLLMQPMSELVTAGKAKFGEVIDSLNKKVFGGFDQDPVKIIPFLMQKTFVVFNNNDPENKEFLRIEPITPDNEDAKYEDEEKDESGDLMKISRFRTMTFYVLLEKELKEGAATPYLIAFSKTSLQAGKKLSTQVYMKNIHAGKNPASMIMNIKVDKQSQDKKTWAVFDVETGTETPTEYQLAIS